MALPVNIEDLLNKRKVEDNRIEFKRGWNPDDIYHSISAFANDIDNLGGGYILVGVEQDEHGLAKRPVLGVPVEQLDKIQKQMVGRATGIPTIQAAMKENGSPRATIITDDGRTFMDVFLPIHEGYNGQETELGDNMSIGKGPKYDPSTTQAQYQKDPSTTQASSK